MSYNFQVFVEQDGKATNIDYMASRFMRVQSPFEILASEDFKQTFQQHSLPQTSLIYTNPNNNYLKYLMFVDFDMIFHIYELSSYLTLDDKKPKTKRESLPQIPEISETNLYRAEFINSNQRLCTNLIHLDKDELFMNCQATDGLRATQVIIDISDIINVRARYYTTQTLFEKLRDGSYEVMRKYDDFSYLMLTKENRTVCQFEVEIIRETNEPETKLRISYFHQPPLNEQEKALYNITKPEVRSCEQTEPFTYNSTSSRVVIDFLQIQDFDVVPFHQDVIVATDYNYGLLFYSVSCASLVANCTYMPLAIIQEQGLSAISILPDQGLQDEKIIFVMKVDPPWIFEVKYDTPQKPSVRRIYRLMSDSDGQYVSLRLMDANKDYVLAHMFSSQLMKPVIRIYKRSNSFFSIGHAEFTYSDFLDQGVFFQFISVRDNYFLVKTSDYFSIFKITPQQLIINATDFTFLTNNEIVNSDLHIVISAQDVTQNISQTQLDLRIVSNQALGQTLRKFLHGQDKQPQIFEYNCGESKINISYDGMYQGAKFSKMILKDLNQGNPQVQDLLAISQLSFKYINSTEIEREGCQHKSIITYELPNPKQKKEGNGKLVIHTQKVMQCLNPGSSSLYFEQLEKESNSSYFKQQFDIQSASIIEFLKETNNDEMFILSKKNNKGEEGAVLHFLKFYNRLAWEGSLDINQKYPMPLPFRFRQFSAIFFNADILMGLLLSQPRETDLDQSLTLLLFNQNLMTKDADMKIIASLNIVTPKIVTVQHSVLDRHGRIWVAFSNSSLALYEFKYKDLKEDPNPEFIAQIYYRKTIYLDTPEELISIKLYPGLKHDGDDSLISRFSSKISRSNMRGANTESESEDCCVDMILLFFGKNITKIAQVVRGDTGAIRMLSQQLPLYFGQSDEDVDTEVIYEYIKNSYHKDVVFHKYGTSTAFILMKRKSNTEQFMGYTLFIYDLSQLNQGTLLFKQQLPEVDWVVGENVRIDAFPIDDDPSRVDLYIFTDETKLVQYRIQLINEINLRDNVVSRLIKACAYNDTKLMYKLYPDITPKESVDIVINAVNNGLAVIKALDSDTITLGKEDFATMKTQGFIINNELYEAEQIVEGRRKRQASGRQRELMRQNKRNQTASYSLLRVFRGQNISYQVQCSDRNKDCNGTLAQIETSSREFQWDIEVLGSSVNLIGFFVIEPSMLFFGNDFLHVYFPDQELFRSYEMQKSALDENTKPARYFLNTISRFKGRQLTHLLFFQDDSNRLGVTRVYSNYSFNETQQFRNDTDNFLSIDDIIFMQKPKKIIQVQAPWEIFQTEIFELETPQFGVENPNQYIKVRVIMAVYDPKILYNSLIRFEDLIFQNLTSQTEFDESASSTLSVNRLGLDTFTVNSMCIISNSTMLALGVQNYGIILYDILDKRIIKFLKFASHLGLKDHSFYVNGLIPQQDDQSIIHAIINNNAVFSIEQKKEDDIDSLYVNNIYLDQNIPRSLRRDMVIGKQGFAFIQGSRDDSASNIQTRPILKFFTFYANYNSKGIGELNLELNENCKYLRSLPYNLTQRNFISEVTQDSLIVAMICGGSLLKVKAYDYRPDLLINLKEANSRVIYEKEIKIYPYNSYKQSIEDPSEWFTLKMEIQNSENDFLFSDSILFVISLAIFVLLSIKYANKHVQDKAQERKKQEAIKEDNSATESSSNA